jgi:mRNA interferase HicA
MTSQEMKRWLAKQGCAFEARKESHFLVRLGNHTAVLPMHNKDLGKGLERAIEKQLGLKGK